MKTRNLIITGLLASCIALPTIASEQSVDERIQLLEQQLQELKATLKAQQAEIKQVEMNTIAPAQSSAPASKSGTTYKFGGFVKATASLSDYSEGDRPPGNAGRDFYIPGLVPVGDGSSNDSADFDFSAKESRINFKSSTELDNGSKLSSFIEMDFLLTGDGNERVSNSYNPRLRHAFLTYNNWLVGQTWSTFQNVGALPESVDFLGASEGIIFERQPMVRYTNGPWQFALENPETTVTPFGGGGRIVTDDASTPDLVGRYNYKGERSSISVAALVRSLQYEDGAIDSSESSIGLSLTGKVKVGARDDIRFNLNTGSGMGRYAGLNTANGAVLDASGELQAIDSTSAAVSYRHVWNDKWRSNFIYSTFSADNDTALTGTGVTKSVSSYQVNLLTSPAPKLTLGVGYLFAERELESGIDGDLGRLIFTAKYGF